VNEEGIQITKVRGRIFDWIGGIKVFAMFHPSYLLRNASRAPGSPKSLTWEDIQNVRKMYDQLLSGKNIDI
jgi:DNA polymerase